MKAKAHHIEAIVLSVLILCFLLLGPASILDKRLNHPHPYNILASDAGGELSFVRALQEEGGYTLMSSHHCAGYDDCLGFLPYTYQHSAVVFSDVTGVPIHNTNIFFACLFLILSALMMYLVIKKWNANMALLALPLMVFTLFAQFNISLLFGYYDVIVVSTFVFLSVYLLPDPEKGKKWILLAILLAASFLMHVSEVFYIGLIYLIYYVLKWTAEKSIKKQTLLFFAKTASLMLPLILYYLVILLKVFPSRGFIGDKGAIQSYDPILSNFSLSFLDAIFESVPLGSLVKFIPLALIILGGVLGVFLIKRKAVPLFIAVVMFILGFDLQLSFVKFYQVRYLWPIYLAVLFAIPLYLVLKSIKVKKVVFAAVSLVLLITISYASHQPLARPGLIGEPHWQSMLWLKDNTPEDAQVTVLYGDLYGQDALLWNTFRVAFRVPPNIIVEKINENNKTKYLWGHISGPGEVRYAYWDGFLNPSQHADDQDKVFAGIHNICEAQYVMFDRVSSQAPLSQYSALIAQELVSSESFEVAYQNEVVVILENKAFESDCFEDGVINA